MNMHPTYMKHLLISFSCFLVTAWTAGAAGQTAAVHELTISGREFRLDDRPFPYTGVSFFNALYNKAFNPSSAARRQWLAKFHAFGINVLRVWCQWDNARGFVDASPAATLYLPDGRLRPETLATAKALLADADAEGLVIELCLFSQESWRENIRLEGDADRLAVAEVARELKPWRNVTFQIWNEHHDDRVLPLVKVIKEIDPKRLVTSSPGYAGVLGPRDLNTALDYLTPHTSRQGAGKTWELAPREIALLLASYNKPVVDDEPARNGTASFGGPKDRTWPADHILHIWEVRNAGGYVTYHHDMFQTGYGTPACPPQGVPDPEFSPYHRTVFEFLAQRERYFPMQ